jgi:hypothetical protein
MNTSPLKFTWRETVEEAEKDLNAANSQLEYRGVQKPPNNSLNEFISSATERSNSVKNAIKFANPLYGEDIKPDLNQQMKLADDAVESFKKKINYKKDPFADVLNLKLDDFKLDTEIKTPDLSGDDSEEGIDWMKLGKGASKYGTAALEQLPSQLAMFSSKPTSASEANHRVIGSTANMAMAGMKAGGPIGAGVGAVVGLTTGLISNKGWFSEKLEKEDRIAVDEEEAKKQERINYYLAQNDSDRIKAEQQILARSLGYNS